MDATVSPRAIANGCSKEGTDKGAVGELGRDRLGSGASTVGEAGRISRPCREVDAGSAIKTSMEVCMRGEEEEAEGWLDDPARRLDPLPERDELEDIEYMTPRDCSRKS